MCGRAFAQMLDNEAERMTTVSVGTPSARGSGLLWYQPRAGTKWDLVHQPSLVYI